jgi:hypothetical protein
MTGKVIANRSIRSRCILAREGIDQDRRAEASGIDREETEK